MANNLINPADNPVFEAGASAERKRLHDAFRRIAARYESYNGQDARDAELVIRRAIEEVFEGPVPEEASVSERKRK